SLVLADTSLLATLPVRELRCGLAEAVKHAVIADPGLLDILPRFAFCKTRDAAEPCSCLSGATWLAPFVARAMAVKIHVIQQDPFEKGLRASLNLGHTLGHGIEKATHFAVQHGEAIALGTVLEATLAEELKLAKPGLAANLATLFVSLGLSVTLPKGIDLAEIQAAITLDKKKAGGTVRFALPVRLGEVRTGVTVDEALLARVLTRQGAVDERATATGTS
ncbi:MAG: 3-dehydroquinate synthase, partial [bacterium]